MLRVILNGFVENCSCTSPSKVVSPPVGNQCLPKMSQVGRILGIAEGHEWKDGGGQWVALVIHLKTTLDHIFSPKGSSLLATMAWRFLDLWLCRVSWQLPSLYPCLLMLSHWIQWLVGRELKRRVYLKFLHHGELSSEPLVQSFHDTHTQKTPVFQDHFVNCNQCIRESRLLAILFKYDCKDSSVNGFSSHTRCIFFSLAWSRKINGVMIS